MKVSTSRATTHNVTLDPEEWFTVPISDDRLISVDMIEAHQATDDSQWDLTLRGNRVLKSGEFGKRARVTTWEHSRAFNDAARKALWARLPYNARVRLALRGVQI